MRVSRLPGFAAIAAIAAIAASVAIGAPARAADDEQGPTADQLQSWLATEPGSADVSAAPDAPEAPPPPPRRHGFVVESSVGVLGHLGALRHVSPTEPFTRVAFGFEPTKWLMLLVQGDAAFGSTEYANPPPAPRGFAILGASGALRLGVQPFTSVGFFVQGEIGAAGVTEDALLVYGFTDSDSIAPYFGGMAGIEWYQVSPHLALALNGGIRSYGELLSRQAGDGSVLAWNSSLGLKYTF
jgi:hypothetical protein